MVELKLLSELKVNAVLLISGKHSAASGSLKVQSPSPLTTFVTVVEQYIMIALGELVVSTVDWDTERAVIYNHNLDGFCGSSESVSASEQHVVDTRS